MKSGKKPPAMPLRKVGLAIAKRGEAARTMLEDASEYHRLVDHLGLRPLDERVVDAAVWVGAPREGDLADEVGLAERIAPAIEARLRAIHPAALPVLWNVEADPEHGGHRLIGVTRLAGAVTRTVFDADFCRSVDYQRLSALAARVRASLDPKELFITEFTQVMGVHTGPGLLGFAFYTEPQ